MREKSTIRIVQNAWGSICIIAFASITGLPAKAQSPTWDALGPAPRNSQTAILDPGTNRMVIFGGLLYTSNSSVILNQDDVWRLEGKTWVHVVPQGAHPAPRAGHSAVYDAVSNRMIVFAGQVAYSAPWVLYNDVWVLTNANGQGGTPAWIKLLPSGGPPPPRCSFGAAYDPNSNRMIIFGGDDAGTILSDVWVLSNANGLGGTPVWTQLAPSGGGPGAREPGSFAYDPATNTATVFGGTTGYGTYFNDLWTLSNANGLGGTPAWSQLSPAGSTPSPRAYFSTIYDASNNRMVIFGGVNSGELGTQPLGETWLLANANGSGGSPVWTQLGPFNLFAEARYLHTAVYSPSLNRMIVFGGLVANPQTPNPIDANDVFVLNNANGL